MDSVETISINSTAREDDKQWNMVRMRELNGKNIILSIWSLNKKIDPYDTHIKNKDRLYDHGFMQ